MQKLSKVHPYIMWYEKDKLPTIAITSPSLPSLKQFSQVPGYRPAVSQIKTVEKKLVVAMVSQKLVHSLSHIPLKTSSIVTHQTCLQRNL